jgi:hypothetical protein
MVMKEEKHNGLEQITLTGYILATDFNRHGKVTEIVVETEDFQQYLVDNSPKSKKLIDYVYEEVFIKGLITGKDIQGKPILQVKEFKITQSV